MYCAGIVNAVEKLPDVTEILRRFTSAYLKHPVTVDIICDGGQTWVKVIACNVKALTTDIDGTVNNYVDPTKITTVKHLTFTCTEGLSIKGDCNWGQGHVVTRNVKKVSKSMC